MHTCAAVSTASGKSGIAVIRISGDDAINIASCVFVPKMRKSLCDVESNKAVFGTAFSPDGQKIDTGIALIFRAPKSYTGEDTVEISCHGSPVGVSLILSSLFANGAEPALPGEFTKRAFVNGKLDLTQAEAVADLLEAENITQLKLSSAQLEGKLGDRIEQIADRINSILAAVYAYIDYPDEDMSDMTDEEIKDELCVIKEELYKLESTYSSGVAVTKGVNTVIAGAPNTGKSTFFNLLAGYDRAIVTDIAGTTRDVITESIYFGGIKLLVSDTAGLHDTADVVEKIGVERSNKALESAKLLFALFDGSAEISADDESFIKRISSLSDKKQVVAIINKSDIASENIINKYKNLLENNGIKNVYTVCAKTGEGKDVIEKALSEIYPITDSDISSGLVLTNARQYAAVKKASEHIQNAEQAINTLTRDMAGLDLEAALGALYEADGRQVSEKVINTIFSRFCVGK